MSSSRAILQKMLDRLFAALLTGPAMNCRPHSSRQRVDLTHLARLQDISAERTLLQLLGEPHAARLAGKAAKPKRELKKSRDDSSIELSEEDRRVARQWSDQQTLLGKLRTIAEDSRTYEQDTGVHVLNIGFPLLSIPPGGGSAKARGFLSRRIVAPIAFIPVMLEVKAGTAASVQIACKGEGVDLVRPNIALLAWLEQQTGKKTPELFDDREAENPWREIHELTAHVAKALQLAVPEALASAEGLAENFSLAGAPRADEEEKAGEIVPAAVLGLFPMANEGLLRDTQEMCRQEQVEDPVTRFLQVDMSANAAQEEEAAAETRRLRTFADERLVAPADPCQSRAALLARKAAGLVIHGPPGTGKSQTITNIIGDHLARGQRVLMVCDKRTALDVVAHRLNHLGFGPLLAIVHDPQRDQRELYKAIRERLENLSELNTRAGATRDVDRADTELQQLHGELSAYWKSLMAAGTAEALSFHDAIGEWLAIDAAQTGGIAVPEDALAQVPLPEGRAHERIVHEILE
ncbi:MAG TPA: DUF4011 domain-containing protein, partial [Phycisphaerae bacterium]|nr:DUF4011 domain-containing protein [Phycisphaerae bacterium]